MKQRLARQAATPGFSLVEILVVALLLVALGGGLAYFYLGHGSSKPGNVVRTPIARANDTVCLTNLRSVRQAIEAARASDPDGNYPQSLTELKELPAELLSCPVGHEPYQYDPTTGQVHCVHPGHENF